MTISNWEKLPAVLNLHTVALIYGVTDSTIKRWVTSGALKGTKIGRLWFFDKDYIHNTVR